MTLNQLKEYKKYKVKLKSNYCSAGGVPKGYYPINDVFEIKIGPIDSRNGWFRAFYNREQWWFSVNDFIWYAEKRKAPAWL